MNKETIEKLLKANPYDSRFSLRENEKSRSDVWCKFQVVFFENEQQPFAHCKDCGAILSYSGKIGTASLLRHKCYLLTHFAPRSAPTSSTVVKALSELNPKHLTTVISSSLERTATVPDLVINSIAQQQVGFVVRDLYPIDAMEGEGFKALAQSLINLGAEYGKQDVENILSKRKGLSRTIIPSIYYDIKSEIKESLKLKNPAFAMDVWQAGSTGKTFLTVTAHVITDFKFQTIALGTREIDKTIPNSTQMVLLNIIGEFVPNPQDALVNSAIVVDGLSNVPAALNQDNWIISSCHSLNAILDEVFSENSSLPDISSLVIACKNLVHHLNNFGINRKLCKPLKSENVNHWQPVSFMLEDISKMFLQIQEILAEENQLHLLNEIDINSISSLINFLGLFKECYESLSRQDRPNICEVVLWKHKLLRYQLQAHEADSNLLDAVKHRIRDSFETRFILDDTHYVALFLDPDFKGMKFLNNSERQRVIEKVIDMIKGEICQELVYEDEYFPKMKRLCKDRFAEFRDSNSDVDDSHVSEVKQYIYHKSNETNVLEFWKNASNFPRLQKLATKILSIPASSSCSDRKCLKRDCTLKERRNRVLSDDYDMILFLHQNT